MWEWIRQVFDAPEFGIAVLPAALLLGSLTAVGSGCNVAILSGIAGYSASREGLRGRDALLACVCFMLGTILSLAALGALIGYLGEVGGKSLGRYGKMFAGFVMILFGFGALKLLPYRLPAFDPLKGRLPRGLSGAAVFGLAVGGGSTACTMLCCGPLLPVVLGLAALRGQSGWGALILTMFAVGYTVPMTAIMLGVSLGRLSGIAKKATGPIRVVAGIVLIGAGFWLLATM